MKKQWISFDERWPKPKDGYEIIFVTDGEEVMLGAWRVGKDGKTIEGLTKDHPIDPPTLTHWMPFPYNFPEPPVEDA